MSKNPIVREFVRKFDEIQYDMDSHHWLLTVVVFFLGYQLLVAWSLIDLRDGILAAAAGQQKTYQDIHWLKDEVSLLRAELAKAQQSVGHSKVNVQEPATNVGVNPPAPAPTNNSTSSTPESASSKAKYRR